MAFITVPVFPQAFDTAQQLLDEGYEIGTLSENFLKILMYKNN